MGWKKVAKRAGGALLALVVVTAASAGIVACTSARAFDASMDKVYEIPLTQVAHSDDPAVIARGRHVAEALAPCASSHCHSDDLAGAELPSEMGPLATFYGPNLTKNGMGAVYTDAELFRLLRHGVKRDGRSLRFMPVQSFNWLSDSDVVAVISYVRSVPGKDKPNGPTEVRLLGKVMDVRADVPIDVARRIDHGKLDVAPNAPSASADYGRYITRTCSGCHGEHLSGGHVPGTPPSFADAANLTPDATGMAGVSYDEFVSILDTGKKKNGTPLAEFMPWQTFKRLDSTEKKAVFAYLQTVPARPFGQR
jgi:mono/diheme cytochrome c family protein